VEPSFLLLCSIFLVLTLHIHEGKTGDCKGQAVLLLPHSGCIHACEIPVNSGRTQWRVSPVSMIFLPSRLGPMWWKQNKHSLSTYCALRALSTLPHCYHLVSEAQKESGLHLNLTAGTWQSQYWNPNLDLSNKPQWTTCAGLTVRPHIVPL
jgi:hypothetical protein